MRVLVTGSRDWRSRGAVWKALNDALDRLAPTGTLTVVHGDCPTGADRMARDWCEAMTAGTAYRVCLNRITEERHPADWTTHGKRAGYLRNSEMVNAGADLCLAFIRGNSQGATMTADLADKAAITTVIYREDG